MIATAAHNVGDYAIWFWVAMVVYFVVILWIGCHNLHQDEAQRCGGPT